jgi:hypothetical protein
MQERWAKLLVNALTTGSAQVERTFPDILSRLSPLEAATLDALASTLAYQHSTSPEDHKFSPIELSSLGLNPVGIDSLVGLNLLRYTRLMRQVFDRVEDDANTVSGATFTDFGWAFVQACRTPDKAGT